MTAADLPENCFLAAEQLDMESQETDQDWLQEEREIGKNESQK